MNMYKLICLFLTFCLLSCKTATYYYVVRHAEKENTTTMTTDVPLTEAGKQRAEALKQALKGKRIERIYSTNYVRTKATAQPLAESSGIKIDVYDPRDTGFVRRIKDMPLGNILIIGHSNTVDDLVNQLMGQKTIEADLPDSEYGDLFIIKKKGSNFKFEKKHFGL